MKIHNVQVHLFFWWCLILLVSTGQLLKIQIGAPSIFAHEVMMILWMGITAWCTSFSSELWQKGSRVLKMPLVFVALCWLGFGLLSAFLSGTNILIASFYLLRLGFYGVFAVHLAYLVRQHHLSESALWFGVSVWIGLLSWFGYLQYVLLPDMRWLVVLGWDDHYYRLVSTLLDPGFTGLVLTLGIFLAWQKTWLADMRVFRLLYTLFCFGALILTFSRASYITAFVAGLIMWGTHTRRTKKIVVFVVGALFCVGLTLLWPSPGGEGRNLWRTSTIFSRIDSAQTWIHTLEKWQWLSGRGMFVPIAPATTADGLVNHAIQADSWPVLILVGSGIVGSILFLLILKKIFWSRTVSSLVKHVLALVLVHGLFSASLTYPFIVLLLGIVVAATQNEP